MKEAIEHFKNSEEARLNVIGFSIRGSKLLSKDKSSTFKDHVEFDSDEGWIFISLEANW